MIQLDLHGKTWREACAEFMECFNGASAGREGTAMLDIVHGYGSTTGGDGVIRRRLRRLLDQYPEYAEYWAGEDLDDNPGHTLVKRLKSLPDTGETLAERVLAYCETPRTMSKIAGKFRRHVDPQVQQAIRTLERQGRLRMVSKGRFKEYQAT